MVKVLGKNQKAKYGLIRWVGFFPNSDKKIAGLELVRTFHTSNNQKTCTTLVRNRKYFYTK